MYTLLRFLHVLSVVVAVGTNLTYRLLLVRAHREPAHLGHVLETIRMLDLTGLLLVWMNRAVTITTSWVLASLIIFIAVAVIGVVALAPAMRAMRRHLRAGGHETPEYKRAQARAYRIIDLATALVVVILYFMVAKP